MFASILHGLRCLVWFPFAVTSSLSSVVIVNVVVYIFYHGYWMPTLWSSIVLCGLTMPLEYTLRPPGRRPTLRRPAEKTILPQLARALVKAKGQAPGLAHARRTLSKELRGLLAAPVTRPPEAVLHDKEIAQQLAAPAGQHAA